MNPSSKTQQESSHSLARVRVYWGDILYDTRVIPPNSQVTVGKDAKNTFVLDFDSGVLGESWELLRVYEHRAELLYRTKTQGRARLGKTGYPFAELADKSLAVQERAGVYRLQLTEKDQADIELSDLRFKIDWVAEAPRVPKARSLQDSSARRWNAVLTSFVTLAVLATAYWDRTFKPLPVAPSRARTVQLLPRLTPVPMPAPVVEPPPEPVKEKKPEPSAKAPAAKKKAVVPKAVPPRDEMSQLGDLVQGLSSIGTAGKKKPKSSTLAIPGLGASSEALPSKIETESVGETEGQGSGKYRATRTAPKETAQGAEPSRSLARDVVEDLIRRREGKIRHCYEKELAKHPTLRGRFVARFAVGPTGKVISAQSLEDTLKNSAATGCVLQEIKGLQFPPGHQKTVVEYPFEFEPSGT